MGFLDQNNHKPVKGKKQNIDGAESSFRYEIRSSDLGTFESTTTVFHGKNGSNDLELLENIRMRRELIIDGGHRIEVPVPWQKGSKKSAPLDPVIRGRLIRAFYVMGFRELAHRRTFEPAMDGNGTFEKNAWLHSIEVPEHLLKKR